VALDGSYRQHNPAELSTEARREFGKLLEARVREFEQRAERGEDLFRPPLPPVGDGA